MFEDVLLDPAEVQMSIVSPAGADSEGERQLARCELEPGPDPLPGWYLRGIRMTMDGAGLAMTWSNGTVRAPEGRLTVKASSPTLGDLATARVAVKRPRALGNGLSPNGDPIAGYPDYCRAYEGTQVCLKDLIIDTADRWGVPPHYLAAQMYVESSFNPYSFRYEPTSVDFKQLTGDWHATVAGDQRLLLRNDRAFANLGTEAQPSTVQFLPCQSAWFYLPCLAAHPLPAREPKELEPPGSDGRWLIPGLDGAKIQLWVTVTSPAAWPPEKQNFDDACATLALASDQYCVDADAGFVRFGSSPTPPVRVEVIRVVPVATTSPAGFGASIPSVLALINTIRANNPSFFNLPPQNPATTIRQWALGLNYANRLNDNSLERYGRTGDQAFRGERLFTLLRNDPSFEVQGQWFAAASYGLMQLIPEYFRDRLKLSFAPADAEAIKAEYYDPLIESPAKLFNPYVCVPMGAMTDVKVRIDPLGEAATSCAVKPTQCSWERVWRRRFCVFNTGNEEETCEYANKIMNGTETVPGAGSFLPQP